MDKFYNETLRSWETTITEIEIEVDSPSQRIAAVIYLILACLSDVKEYVLKRGL